MLPNEQLLKQLKRTERGVALRAVRALAKRSDPATIRALIEALTKHSDPMVVLAAAEVLGDLRDPKAVPVLVEAYRTCRPSSRQPIADALVRIGDLAVPPLAKILKAADSRRRRIAAEVLGKIGARSAVPCLTEALDDRHLPVRKASVCSLGEIGEPSAVPSLLKALKQRRRGDWRLGLAEVLEKMGKSARPGLLAALNSEDRELSMNAASILTKAGTSDGKVAQMLIRKLGDMDPKVRADAATALGNVKSRVVVQPLRMALEDENQSVRIDAAAALLKLSARVKMAVLALNKTLDSLNQDDWDLWFYRGRDFFNTWEDKEAARALVKISSAAVPFLIQNLASGYLEWKAVDVCMALGKIGVEAKAAVPYLIEALNRSTEADEGYRDDAGASSPSYIQDEAARSLGKIGGSQSIEGLTRWLRRYGGDPWRADHRRVVTAALRRLGASR
jgi:HEAT repeat protein